MHPEDRRTLAGERKAGRLQRNREHEKVSGCAKALRHPSVHLLRVDSIIDFTNFLRSLEENLISTNQLSEVFVVFIHSSGIRGFHSHPTSCLSFTQRENCFDISFSYMCFFSLLVFPKLKVVDFKMEISFLLFWYP